jgi:ankyrin repeat protein
MAVASSNNLLNALLVALRNSQLHVFQGLLDCKDASPTLMNDICESTGMTLLHVAAKLGRYYNVEILIKKGAEVDVTDALGNTPMHYAVSGGYVRVTKLLVSKGSTAITDAKINQYGDTVLHHAAWSRNSEIIGEIMDLGFPDSKLTNQMGMAPIHYAVQGGSVNNVRAFVLKDPTLVNLKDAKGQNPLHYAALGDNDIMIDTLLELGNVSIDEPDNMHYTALHFAAGYGKQRALEALIRHGATHVSTAPFFDSSMPVHIAAINGHVHIIKVLAAHDYSVLMHRDAYGRTVMHIAVLSLNFHLVELLMKSKNTLVSVTDYNGLTPMHYAIYSHNAGIVGALVLGNRQLMEFVLQTPDEKKEITNSGV